jgi:Phage integrase family
VFCKPGGNPYDPDETTRRFQRRAKSCPAVLPIHFHDMRHTHATLLLEAGETVRYVAERLGDREDTVIETYAHVTPRMRSAAVSKVRAFLGADPGAGAAALMRPPVASGDGAFREPPVSPLEGSDGREAQGGTCSEYEGLVGGPGFEPGASRSRTVRAAGLRQPPPYFRRSAFY